MATQQGKTQQQPGKKPNMEWRAGNIKLAVWIEEKTTQGGDKYLQYSMVLSKSFKREGDTDWTEQKVTLFLDELPNVSALLHEAFIRAKLDFKCN